MGDSSIEKREGAGGVSSYIKGTRMRVVDIARLYSTIQDELIAERICGSAPGVSVDQVLDAIEYWRKNPQEIDDLMREEEEILKTIPTKI